jgi:D-glycerate 3-kinase
MQPSNSSLNLILQNWVAGQAPSSVLQQQLETWLLEDSLRAKAFGINSTNVSEAVKVRSHLLQGVYPAIQQFCQPTFCLESDFLVSLWNLWLPLALELAASHQALGRPFIQGILGGQGTGKTTLAAILTLLLSHLGYRTLSFSLDDLYKTYPDRLSLRAEDPRLIWRGPPGTHDVELGCMVLDQLRHADPSASIQVPRFDKSAFNGAGDRTVPEVVTGVAIVLFEGWFVGARPIEPAAFATAPPPIVTEADREFAREMNAKLRDYLPLWSKLDRLMVLHPTDYRLSQQWRRQAEHQMIAAGKNGMSDREIDQFVEYFWKALHPELFIQPLTRDRQYVDLVVEINPDHSPGSVYRPQDYRPQDYRPQDLTSQN